MKVFKPIFSSKKNTALLDASKEAGVKVKAEETSL
jgi:hypothetical protein